MAPDASTARFHDDASPDGQVGRPVGGQFASAAEVKAYHFQFSWRQLLAFAGPGWVMSLAYLDPGNLEADLQQGAYTNLRLVWVLWWATGAGLLLQELSSRLSVVTGMNLAECSRQGYSRTKSLLVYAMMELAIIGSDIQEVVGSAIAINLLFGLKLWVGCLITGIDTFIVMTVHSIGVRYFEAVIVVLVGLISVCFFFNWYHANEPAVDILEGWAIPSLPEHAMMQAVGTIGAVIMPHNLYLHSGLVTSREVNRDSYKDIADANMYNFYESSLALLTSFFVNLAVVTTFAHWFYSPECAPDSEACVPMADSSWFDGGAPSGAACTGGGGRVSGFCAEIGLDEAGSAMWEAMGPIGMKIWAVGLLAAGQASCMSTTMAGQMVMDGFLDIRMRPWKRVLLTRIVSLGPSLFVAVGTSDNSALRNNINEWLNILQSVQLPFAIIPVLTFTASPRLMGRFRNRGTMLYLSWLLTAVVVVSNVFLVVDFAHTTDAHSLNDSAFMQIVAVLGCLLYFGLLGALVFDCRKVLAEEVPYDEDGSGVKLELTTYGALPLGTEEASVQPDASTAFL